MGVELVSQSNINPKDYGYNCNCTVTYIHVRITNIKKRAEIIKTDFLDKSWINNLKVATKISYETRVEKTISKLIRDVLNKVENTVTKEFGEILISTSARDTLCNYHNHGKIPLAELWKEKISGNPGFDFHTETPTHLIAFGEAKYKKNCNAYNSALKQIHDFINEGKDLAELSDLQHLVGSQALSNITDLNLKAFVAAFSLYSKDDNKNIAHIMKNKYISKLLFHSELYIIGIEI